MNRSTEGPREKMALLIACGSTTIGAAKACGVKERTARSWTADPAFQARVAELRRGFIDSAIGQMSAVATKAVRTLVDVMEDRSSSAADRVRAARGLLADLARMTELHDLAERVARLEARSPQRRKPRHG